MEEEIRIVIVDNDYMEAYAPFPKDPKAAEDKVKIGMLKSIGMSAEEIARIKDSLEIEYVAGADGMFDDGPMTPIELVKIIRREPPVIEYPDPVPEPEETKENAEKPRQTMLQQYYGDRKAERRRRETFDRFKSHIKKDVIDVYDEDGTKRKAEVYTIEDYEGKKEDSNELLIDGYETRLERLSRAHQRDFSPYVREFQRLKTTSIGEIMAQYEEMHRLNPEEAEQFKEEAMQVINSFADPEIEKKAIQALIDRDIEFIETNNYTYNRRQNTAENLKTLGKYGEKSVKGQISDEQSKSIKFGLRTMNVLIDIRNHTTAPVNKAIGTYVASPIYRAILGVTQSKSKEPVNVDGFYITPMEDILATSQKRSRGMFANKPSHRYTARKDYFIKKELDEMKKDPKVYPEGKIPRITLGKLIKLAIVPRVNAIFNYKEGNIAILNAGLHDIEEATRNRHMQLQTKRHTLLSSQRRIANYEKEIEDLKLLEKSVKDPVEKKKIQMSIEQREACKLKLQARYAETKREEIDSVSTDAVSMSQHDKANKSNITKVVRGVKLAARVTAGIMISKYLYREVAHQAKTPDTTEYIPGETIEEEVTKTITETVQGMDAESVAHITLEDIYKKGSGLLTYHAHGGNQIQDKTSFFRGLAFEYEGKLLSGSDGVGFDPTKLTDVKIDQNIDGNTTLVSLVQEIIQDKTGQAFSTDEIGQMIIDGRISGFDIWRSTSENGIPMGWLDSAEIVSTMINTGTHTITKEITEKIIKTLPGKTIIKPGIEYTYYTTEINPLIAAIEAGLGAAELADWNDLLRYTRSQDDIERRHPKLLRQMKIENDKLRAKKAAEKESETSDTTKENGQGKEKIKKKREIKSFQRTTKSKVRLYFHQSTQMQEASRRAAEKKDGVTIFEKFTGSKKADMQSGYDENLLGVNREETPINDDIERD